MIEFVDVKKYHHSYMAINYLNGKLYSDRIAVFGVEKSGKSSLLRLIAGVDKPTEGQILINDRPLTSIEKDVYFTFRDGGFLNKTLYDNLVYPLKIRNETNIESKVDSVIKEFGLENIKKTKAKKLTFQDRATAILAKIKLRETKLLLIDNPFEMLDSGSRKTYFEKFTDIIKDYQGTVIYSTDNLEELAFFSDVILMNYGVVKGIGKLDDILNYPNNLFSFSLGQEITVFNGKLIKQDRYYFENTENKIVINDIISSKIASDIFVGQDVILAVRNKNIAKEKIELIDLNENENVYLFDWNENSILK